MKIWNGGLLLRPNNVWGAKSKDAVGFRNYRWDNAHYISADDESLEFKNKLDNIFGTIQEIKETDSIYFFKESKYPRYKFSENCKNPKTIKIDNADKLVIPNCFTWHNRYNTNVDNYFIIEDSITNTSYLFTRTDSHLINTVNQYNQNTLIDGCIMLLKDKFLIHDDQYKTYEKLLTLDVKISTANPDLFGEFFNNVINNIDKCISEESLEKYLSKDIQTLDEEMSKTIDTMLKSTDRGVVELGLKMLCNFNIEKSAMRIGLLIRSNINSIEGNPALTSVGFKNVLSQLGINIGTARHQDTLAYLNQLYKNTSDDENKRDIREATRSLLEERSRKFFETLASSTSAMTFNVNLEVA